jgi:hypothetical protein
MKAGNMDSQILIPMDIPSGEEGDDEDTKLLLF